MNNVRLTALLTSCVTIALLAGCGESQSPIGTPGATAQSRTIATHADRGTSWMLPEAKTAALLYVSRGFTRSVDVFTFPRGKQVGSLTGFGAPTGLCSDDQGNVFVVDNSAQQIVEYAHGGDTPIDTLQDSPNDPNGCAVDPLTHNLAVAGGNANNSQSEATITIFVNSQGTGTAYSDNSLRAFFYCTYDSDGNVFTVPPFGRDEAGTLVELPNAGSSLTSVAVDHKFNIGLHPLQWDGTYLAVEDRKKKGTTILYRIKVSGSTGTVVSVRDFPRAKGMHPRLNPEFWIYAQRVVAPETYNTRLGIWPYPRLGNQEGAIKIKPGGGFVFGDTVSVAR